ncbi:MAG: FtsX-like permease family protein [Betaproteobacteria bacterium]|nr:FtsX-like permease family protein [Betaproteobacteria bacterium]
MNLLRLTTRELRANPLGSGLAVLLLALGIATLTVLLLFVGQLEDRFGRDARGIDLVVGAKGSPMQIILSGIYHLDVPTGNIPLAEVRRLQALPQVRRAMPLALGDSFGGFRIVGAPPEYVAHYEGRPSAGRLPGAPMEAVLGAEVAARTGMKPGDAFAGAHGLAEGGPGHDEAPYQVVGVLAPGGTVLDRLILTPVDSVWRVHEGHGAAPTAGTPGAGAHAAVRDGHDGHDGPQGADAVADVAGREVTVVLLQYASPLAAVSLPRMINQATALQAASPAFETARLLRLVGVGRDVLHAFAGMLVAGAAAALGVALLSALRGRRYDIAVMRLLGASRAKIFTVTLLEALLLATAGALLGLALGHGLVEVLGGWLAREHQPAVTGLRLLPGEGWLLVLAWAIGLVAAGLPAWSAARTDVAVLLSGGNS